MNGIRKFFSDVKGSARGILIPEELYRSIIAALGSGTIVGLVILILQSVLDHVGVIFPNPSASSLMTMLLTLILDLLRRQNHGGKPSPVMVPGTIDIPSPSPVAMPESTSEAGRTAEPDDRAA
jgi:hypothetical protein